VFASEQYLPFLVQLVTSEKPFVAYHAIRALQFAVGALHPRAPGELLTAIHDAQAALNEGGVQYNADRLVILRQAEQELVATMAFLAGPDA
jgi:hypothetical protein